MTPFLSIGETARWKIIYLILKETPVGGIATYEQMATALDLDPDKDRHVIQVTMRRAAKEFEIVDKYVVEAVTNVGYRVVEADERLRLARGDERKSIRSLRRGQGKLENILPEDLGQLSPAMQKLIHNASVLISEQLDFNRRMSIRQKKMETALAMVEKKSTATDEQVAELETRLKKLEQKRQD